MNYVAIDLETANDFRGSICSVGLAKFNNGVLVDEYYSLVNPEEEYFSYMNIEIHGITEEDVIDKPTFPFIATEINRFVEDYPLVAHFSQFDMYALEDAYRKYGLEIPNYNYFCSYRLSKQLYTLPSYRLPNLCSYFGIDNSGHHNALADARMCGFVTKHIFTEHQITLEQFVDEQQFRFGKLGYNGFRKKDKSGSVPIELTIDESKFQVDHEFFQKNICFTGALKSMTRAEAAQKVTDIGANFNKGITKNTNYLVVGNLENLEKTTGESKSSKLKKAESLANNGQNIEILSEMEFTKLL